jgi:hypothetical protein
MADNLIFNVAKHTNSHTTNTNSKNCEPFYVFLQGDSYFVAESFVGGVLCVEFCVWSFVCGVLCVEFCVWSFVCGVLCVEKSVEFRFVMCVCACVCVRVRTKR